MRGEILLGGYLSHMLLLMKAREGGQGPAQLGSTNLPRMKERFNWGFEV